MLLTSKDVMPTNMTTDCRNAIPKEPIKKHWGFSYMLDDELAALRVAYAYRGNPHGVKVEHCPNVSQYMVTVWNEKAKPMGLDVS